MKSPAEYPLALLRHDFDQCKIRLIFSKSAPNMVPLDSVLITNPSVIVRARTLRHGPPTGAGAGKTHWPTR